MPSRTRSRNARSHPGVRPSKARVNCSGVATPLARSCRSRSARGDLRLRPLRLVHRQASLGEIPDALLPVPPDDHHLALEPQDVEHHGHAACTLVVPSTGLPAFGGPVFQIARAQGAATFQLAEGVAAERGVRLEPALRVGRAGLVAAPTRVAPHRGAMDREVGGGHDVDPVLEQRALVPQQPFELRHPERRTQPREQHQMLGTGDGRCGIELHHPQVVDGLADRRGARRCQPLTHHAQPAGLAVRELERRRHRGRLRYGAA